MSDPVEAASGDIAKVVISGESTESDFVDPWNVTSESDTGVDYDKLISKSDLNLDAIYNTFFTLLLFRKVWFL